LCTETKEKYTYNGKNTCTKENENEMSEMQFVIDLQFIVNMFMGFTFSRLMHNNDVQLQHALQNEDRRSSNDQTLYGLSTILTNVLFS
jgi:hypothetical protein